MSVVDSAADSCSDGGARSATGNKDDGEDELAGTGLTLVIYAFDFQESPVGPCPIPNLPARLPTRS
jgi:hypothetical protein